MAKQKLMETFVRRGNASDMEWGSIIRISGGTLAGGTKHTFWFYQSLQTYIGHDHFFPNPFQLIIHQSSCQQPEVMTASKWNHVYIYIKEYIPCNV
jgi:hypothetical protein